jgi:hypothetical protein
MSYNNIELAEQVAVKDMAKGIIGNKEDYTVKQLNELFEAMKYNEEGCVEVEKYHLAETWMKLSKSLIN